MIPWAVCWILWAILGQLRWQLLSSGVLYFLRVGLCPFGEICPLWGGLVRAIFCFSVLMLGLARNA